MKNSNIEWTDHTFNPWIGCTKVSPGCANCYAATQDNFRKWTPEGWGAGKPRKRTSVINWKMPLAWDRAASKAISDWSSESGGDGMFDSPLSRPKPRPHRPRVFCASLADWLDDEVPLEWLVDLLDLIRRTTNLDWLLLTKRPENWRARIEAAKDFEFNRPGQAQGSKRGCSALHRWLWDWLNGTPPANVWVGTTVEDQARADERIPLLLSIPARVRFLSCEPLLGPVDLLIDGSWKCPECGSSSVHADLVSEDGKFWQCPDCKQSDEGEADWKPDIHWVICGGESGPGARPMLVEWADDLRRQCEAAGVPFFMKQLGAHVGTTNANALDWPEHVTFTEVAGTPQAAGARVGLNDRKGGDFDEFPTELQVRRFPEVKS